MGPQHKPFRLNRDEGKVMGVCAGIADHFSIDVSLVRVGMALAIIMTFPVVLAGYFILALITQPGGRRPRMDRSEAPRLSPASAEATRDRIRDFDARMEAIESSYASSNTALAHEIDSLR